MNVVSPLIKLCILLVGFAAYPGLKSRPLSFPPQGMLFFISLVLCCWPLIGFANPLHNAIAGARDDASLSGKQQKESEISPLANTSSQDLTVDENLPEASPPGTAAVTGIETSTSFWQIPHTPPQATYFLCTHFDDCPSSYSRVFVEETRERALPSLDDTLHERLINVSTLPPKPKTFGQRLDEHRAFFADQFQDMANTLDRFMSQRHYNGSGVNESYFIIDGDMIFNELEDHEFKVRAKAKVDLSNTQKRLKLIFESQPDEDLSLDDKERPNRPGSRELASNDAIAGLEYAKKKGRFAWRPSIDVGSRLNFPFDAFTRVKLAKLTQLSEKSYLSTRFELPYFAREGAKPSARVSWDYEIRENVSFTTISRYKYTRQERFDEWSQSFQVNHWPNDNLGLEYKIGAVGNDDYSADFSTYYLQTAVKFNIHEQWIWVTVVPAVEYSQENSWESDLSLALKLQLIYKD